MNGKVQEIAKILSHELQNRRLWLTLLVLLLMLPLLPIRSVNATDYSVSSTSSGDFLSQYYPGTNDGSAAGETKLSQDSASQTGTTMYGPNNPIIYSGIQAELSGQSGCATICYLDNIKVTVTITSSSGTFLGGSRITNLGMLVSPADPNNGGTDWAAIFTDLANFLLDVKGLPSIPNFSNGIVPVPSGTGADTSSAWGIWKNPWGSGWHVTAKGINFRYQPNFPSPDVYTINVQSQAEMWVAAFEGSLKDTTVSLSNSFKYVYESDANSGNDAGSSFSTALPIISGSYNGLLYGADTVDMYKFDARAGDSISIGATPSCCTGIQLSIYDPNWNFVTGSGGSLGSNSFRASMAGSWFAAIGNNGNSGLDIYSFSLSRSPGLLLSASPASVVADGISTSAVTAQASDNAPGVTVSFATTLGILSSSTCSTDATGSCTVTVRSSTPGATTISVTAPAYANGQAGVTFMDFGISATPTTLSMGQGFSSTSSVTLTSLSGFTGTVRLTTSVSPSVANGPVASLSAPSVTLSSGATTALSLTISTTASTPYGTYSVNVIGVSGSLSHTVTVTVTVQPPDFSLCCTSSMSLVTGGNGLAVVSVVSLGSFSGVVNLTVTFPSGLTGSLNPTSVTLSPGGSGTSTLTVIASGQTGSYTVTITGVRAVLHHSISNAVTVTPGNGGSVAAGTLITLSDGTQVPVQNLQVGMQLLSYDLSTNRYLVTTITRFYTVTTDNQMVIKTSTGKPLIVDQNPAQELYVLLPAGYWTLMPVTELKIGYSLYDAMSQTWVPITSIQYQNGGQHIMYDIFTSSPGSYIANGYLDPQKT